MATSTIHPSPIPTPTSAPPTPPYPSFPRLPSNTNSPSITRNASTCSSASTSSTTSSLVAAPIRPPPIETRTAATHSAQLPSRPSSADQYGGASRPGSAGGSNHRGGAIRNGPRSRSSFTPPSIGASPLGVGTDGRDAPDRRSRSTHPPGPAGPEHGSPTTPRASRFARSNNNASADVGASPQRGPRVTISMDPMDGGQQQGQGGNHNGSASPLVMPRVNRGRDGQWSTPSSPIDKKSPRMKQRTLSVDGRGEDTRERRTSQASAMSSSSSGVRKPSLKDFILGEELGRGSYSTVVQATSALHNSSPTSPRPPRQYAIKIINQAHLVAEKKVKYAIIERDALIRLAQPSNNDKKGHTRGVSSSSSVGQPNVASRRRSNASIGSAVGAASGGGGRRDSSVVGNSKDRLSVATDVSVSTSSSGPLSPTLKASLAGRRPSRSAEPPEMVPERSEENAVDSPAEVMRSRPPSPVKEEPGESTPPHPTRSKMEDSPAVTTAPPTPDLEGGKKAHRNRRQSMAPSERSVKSGKGVGYAHPGIIRLHSTFNDQTSLYFVLDLAKNGEMLTFIRKYGSFDVDSARYYAAQLIDTIEFMHEREVIHRDLKPENILLDADMRIKITDFGSAKIIGRDSDNQDDGHKRSFVGSADFVSPEVLRSEAAVFASDIWAFGCILFQLLVGKPPFRGATDYLTFQKILKRSFEYPEGMDEEARSLIDLVLNVDPLARPSISDIKAHPFFTPFDTSSLWQIPAPQMSTGLNKPVQTLASVTPDSEMWAVFDDEVSDGGFEYDDAEQAEDDTPGLDERDHTNEPKFNKHAAADAVQFVDNAHQRTGSSGSLEPPRPAYIEGQRKKGRGWSSGSRSARTSSSSSHNRTALTGFLETMGIHPSGSTIGTPLTTNSGVSTTPSRSTRTSRTSDKNEETRLALANGPDDKWSSLLLANERIILRSAVTARSSPSSASTLIPTFLLSSTKSRQLILTDFPRLIEVKDDKEDGGSAQQGPRIKFEAVFVSQPTDRSNRATGGTVSGGGGANRVIDVSGKGSKAFVVNTVSANVLYNTDSGEIRDKWINAIRGVASA